MADNYPKTTNTEYVVYEKETGVYGDLVTAIGSKVTSAIPFGIIKDVNIDEKNNLMPVRGVGTGLNPNQILPLRYDITGNIRFNPFDGKHLEFVLGKYATTGAIAPYTHTITEYDETTESMPSMNIIRGWAGTAQHERRYSGCKITRYSMTARVGEVIESSIDFTGKTVKLGTASLTLTEKNTIYTPHCPYTFAHAIIIMDGTAIAKIKSFEAIITNEYSMDTAFAMGDRTLKELVHVKRDWSINVEAVFDDLLLYRKFLGVSAGTAPYVPSATAFDALRLKMVFTRGLNDTLTYESDVAGTSTNDVYADTYSLADSPNKICVQRLGLIPTQGKFTCVDSVSS